MNVLNLTNMRKYKSYSSNKYLFLSVVLLSFFISNLLLIFYQENVWWDSGVYVGMGKYIYSSGNSGFWEASRPIVWPLILGLLWTSNIDVVLFGKIASLFFSVGVLLMTFLISKEIFDEKIALLAVLFLALTPTFFFFNKIMISGIISTFFTLVAIYFLIKKRYFLSGIFFGIGFMTRFLQLFTFLIVIILFLIYNKNDKKFTKNFVNIIIGFFIPFAPYLVLNYFLYKSILHPFLLQISLTKVTGWMYFEPFWFYFVELFKENFLYIFFIFGLFYLFKKKLNFGKNIVFYLFLIPFLFFIFTKHKEMRFLLMIFPFLYMLASYGIIKFFGLIKNRNIKAGLVLAFSVLFVSQSIFYIYLNEKTEINRGNRLIEFQLFLDKDNLGNIWISNPTFAVYSDKKIDTLIYYPTFDKERINFLNSDLLNADTILLDTCDILCNPNDKQCPGEKDLFISNIKNNFKINFNNNYGNCEQFIFVRK